MEKHICNDLKLSIYTFGNVSLSYELKKKFLHKECDIKKLQSLNSPNTPKWLSYKNDISSVYKDLIVIDIETANLPTEYYENYKLDDEPLLNYINQAGCRQYLTYDVSLKTFDYVTEATMLIPAEKCKDVIMVNDNYGTELDLYNCIRNSHVKTHENENDIYISSYIKNICDKVENVIKDIYDMDAKEQLEIPCNSGNITIVISGDQVENHSDSFFQTNRKAERIEYHTELIEISDHICSFNGRFQTIISKFREKEYHFVPVAYQAQKVWSFLSSMSSTIDCFNLALQEQTHLDITEENKRLISSMIEKSEVLLYKNSSFKSSMEKEYDYTYKKFEENWHLETTLQAQEKYIQSLDGYLSRALDRKNEKANERQNKILFVISLLQILAFISVWTDALELFREYASPIVDFLGINFRGLVSIISVLLPITLMIISSILLINELKKNRE